MHRGTEHFWRSIRPNLGHITLLCCFGYLVLFLTQCCRLLGLLWVANRTFYNWARLTLLCMIPLTGTSPHLFRSLLRPKSPRVSSSEHLWAAWFFKFRSGFFYFRILHWRQLTENAFQSQYSLTAVAQESTDSWAFALNLQVWPVADLGVFISHRRKL